MASANSRTGQAIRTISQLRTSSERMCCQYGCRFGRAAPGTGRARRRRRSDVKTRPADWRGRCRTHSRPSSARRSGDQRRCAPCTAAQQKRQTHRPIEIIRRTPVGTRRPCAPGENRSLGGPRAARRARRADRVDPTRLSQPRAAPRHLPGRVPDGRDLIFEQLAGAAAARRHHRPARRHALGDHHAERLRLGAGVHDDVERPQRGRNVCDVTGEADDVRASPSRRDASELVQRPLAAGGLYTAPPTM